MGVLMVRFRVELRTRWRSWLGLALLIGVAGGVVAATAAGARRTETAYDRFLENQRAFDVLAGCPSPEDSGRQRECDASDLARLPEVENAALLTSFGPGTVEVRTEDGRPLQPDPDDAGYTGPGEVSLAASPDGRFGTEVNRLKILDGRRPDPDRAHEAALSVEVARRLDIGVGDQLRATFFREPEGGSPSRFRR